MTLRVMRKPLFNKVCIVGVGLIGGSLGMAIKKRKIARLVVGVMRRRRDVARNVSTAFRRKALDVVVFNIKEGVKDADLIILCAPVFTIVDQIKKIGPHLKKEAVVIDVGSSKTEIVKVAKKHLRGHAFVGCHPMAGSEKSGVTHSRADLFKNSICFVTSRNIDVEKFWKALDAHPVQMDALSHDKWVAWSSHLPHLLSFALFQGRGTARRAPIVNPSLQDFARLSKSDPDIWSDIFLSNREALLKEIEDFYHGLRQLQKVIRIRNRRHLTSLLEQANRNAS